MRYYGFNGKPISQEGWLHLFQSKERLLAQDTVGDYFLSTVWLGLDHGFGYSELPLIFETMLFFQDEGHDTWRHASKEEALALHAEQLAALRVLEEATS